MNIPKPYDWLASEEAPRHLLKALELYGVAETVGPKHNPVIMGWAKELDLKDYTADEIPWCGLFVATCIHRAGRPVVNKPLWALSWARFGVNAAKPMLGDILTFKRDGGGHVGFYVFETADCYGVLGGNQGNKVCITLIKKDRLFAARRPQYTNQPENIRSIVASGSGIPISTNEA